MILSSFKRIVWTERSRIGFQLLNYRFILRRSLTTGCVEIKDRELTSQTKIRIEEHWRDTVSRGSYCAEETDKEPFYVLSMFPYPSGQLHMGHVRVYSISDCMARYQRLHGKNVLHPMGWDAFGLPAENAAIQRNIPAEAWTRDNIKHMKTQLRSLGTSFDWDRELATCHPDYYRWTQELFVTLFEHGLAYQRKALVNWDPVDNTVLAEEQVDANGRSWRSGAKVEKRLLRQWFLKTTKYAKELYDGLSNLNTDDWKDIIKIQKHWIGECTGYSFNLDVSGTKAPISDLTVWTQTPEYLLNNCFVAIKSTHLLNNAEGVDEKASRFTVKNPFTGGEIPIIVTNKVAYPVGRSGSTSDVYLGFPDLDENDARIFEKHGLPRRATAMERGEKDRAAVLRLAQELNIGGYPISSKLQDWLISRQRTWGTPIPIIHCNTCGPIVPSRDSLPVTLEDVQKGETNCPKCGQMARRESDTMDTFVDSSWYFLRYLDTKNVQNMFDKETAKRLMPVNLYIGGKEHAELHLYYARFISYFLHSLDLLPQPEPFQRLLVQGMVKGRSYRVKETGRYITAAEVDVLDEAKGKAVERSTGKAVTMTWSKMSKSKMNGVDPAEIIQEYGCDTTRLFILGNVAPMSHRNWSTDTFPGILNWQKRIWLTVHELIEERERLTPLNATETTTTTEFKEQERILWDARNYYLSGATFHFKYTQHISAAISNMQGLTNFLRRAPKAVVRGGKEFEAALATQLILLAPLAPHFASECWYRLSSCPNRPDDQRLLIDWNEDVLQQKWPEVDGDYNLDFTIYVNGEETKILKIPRLILDGLEQNEAIDRAMTDSTVAKTIGGRNVKFARFKSYHGCQADLYITVKRQGKEEIAIK